MDGNNSATPDAASNGVETMTAAFGTMSLHSRCSNCGEPAKLVCNGCNGIPKEAEQEIDAIRYCSRECQVAHQPQHKALCKKRADLRTLYRAAALANDIYIRLCDATYGDCVTS